MNAVGLQVASAALLFGIVPLLVKASALSDIQLAVGRLAIASVALLAWGLARQRGMSKLRRAWREAPASYLSFGILHGATILSSFYAIKTINAAVAATLLYAGAIYLVPLSVLLLKERIELSAIVSLCVALAGVGVLCWPNLSSSGQLELGSAVGATSGLLMATVLLVGKRLARTQDRLTMALVQHIVALPLLLPLLLLEQNGLPGVRHAPLLLLLGAGCTALPFVLLYGALGRLSGQRVGVLLLLELATPIVLGPLILGEVPTLRESIGGGLIVIGCAVVAAYRGSAAGAADEASPPR